MFEINIKDDNKRIFKSRKETIDDLFEDIKEKFGESKNNGK